VVVQKGDGPTGADGQNSVKKEDTLENPRVSQRKRRA
jgi:hypothetical protein